MISVEQTEAADQDQHSVLANTQTEVRHQGDDAQAFDYPHMSELTAEGAEVLRCILELISKESPRISETLRHLLHESLRTFNPAILNQLGLLLEAPIFAANPEQKGHWQYELSMVKAVLEHAQKIQKLFGCGEELIVDLCFMIIVSDIGKAGPISVKGDGPESIIYRIFTQAIFFEKHRDWLRNAYDPTTPDNLKPGYFPPDLAPALATISRETTGNAPLSKFSETFQSGFFFALPIEAYLHVIKTIALEIAHDDADLAIKAEQLFTLKPEEKEFIASIGYDTQSTGMRKFFTESHIAFGDAFLQKHCRQDQLPLVELALTHHFSQGVFPRKEFAEQLYTQPDLLKLCAFMEILDKVEAAYHRMQERGIAVAISSVSNDIFKQLATNHPEHPELSEVYQEMLSFMIEQQIFTGLD